MPINQGFVNDTAEGRMYYENYLTHWLPKIISRRKPVNSFANGSVIPTMMDLPVYAQHMKGLVATEFGRANEISESLDLNTVSVNLEEVDFKVWATGVKATRTWAETQGASLSMSNGFPQVDQVLSRKFALTYQALEDWMNQRAAFGAGSVPGFLNDPDVPTNNLTIDFYDPTTTAQAMINAIAQELSAIVVGTSQEQPLRESGPTKILIPQSLLTVINTTQVPNTPYNVRTWLLNNLNYLDDIVANNGVQASVLESFGVTNPGDDVNMMVLYPYDVDVVHRRESVPTMLPTEYHNATYHMPLLQATSQTVWEQPQYARYSFFDKGPLD